VTSARPFTQSHHRRQIGIPFEDFHATDLIGEFGLYEARIRPLEERALGVQQLREDQGDETERDDLVLGVDRGDVVVRGQRRSDRDPSPRRDEEFLVELPKSVQILDITSSHGDTGGRA
jgi:hypothetical protein